MAIPISTSDTVNDAVTNAFPTDIEQFKIQWEDHLKLQERGLIVYYVPKLMGQNMGNEALKQSAMKLCLLTENDTYVHFDLRKSAYRIGFFDPSPDAGQDIFIFEAKHNSLSQFQHYIDKEPSSRVVYSTSDYKPNHSRVTLAKNSPKPCGVVSKTKIPKPRNMWIIYRQDKHISVQSQNPGMHASKLSSIISQMWQAESADVKECYKRLAEEEKARHRQQYPAYKCSPRKPSDIKRRKPSSKHIELEVQTPANEFHSTLNTQDWSSTDDQDEEMTTMSRCKIFPDLLPTSTPDLCFPKDDSVDIEKDGSMTLATQSDETDMFRDWILDEFLDG
ncbi:hypothetical protein B7463_g1889, partial [Scytalidium lignicola]